MSQPNASSLSPTELASVWTQEQQLLCRIIRRRFRRTRVSLRAAARQAANDNANPNPTPPHYVAAFREQCLLDPERLRDALGETRARFVAAVNAGRVERGLAGHWLAATAWRTGAELFRRWARQSGDCVPLDEKAEALSASLAPSFEDACARERLLRAVLGSLTDEERLLLNASVLDTYGELSLATGVSIPTLRQRMHTLRERLRQRWGGEFAELAA